MTRRNLFGAAAGFAAIGCSLPGQTTSVESKKLNRTANHPPAASSAWGSASDSIKKLNPPANGRIPVAFPISTGAVVIDYSGPWEVFQDTQVVIGNDNVPGFSLYTVAETAEPVRASGGMKLVPNYTFENAPAPKVIVIPAQQGNDEMIEWVKKASKSADLTMSVCTGAFLLAKTGLLSGKAATTHHGSYGQFAMQYRDIRLQRGFRFVDAGDNVASAGGLTSGIDLALHVVERYYGRFIAERTAYYMEYQGTGWLDASGASNAAYAAKPKADALTDPVCGMAASKTLESTYKGVTYHFCSEGCKKSFDQAPSEYANEK